MANRKLQTEIDRVLKKVEEGVVIFEDIWDKVKSAATPNLKEKYEGDLKKEIKKLQRYRDQIKTWAASNEVKKKNPLLDARKLIETKMEKFKILEKETKTKAYSKEGLSKAAKKKKAKDPQSSPAWPTIQFLAEIEETLMEQKEHLEGELQELQGSNKKKKGDADQMDLIARRIERHQWHLEQIGNIKDRLSDKESLYKKVEELKDSIQYYVDSSQEPDFVDDDTMYEGFEELADEEDATISEDDEEEDDDDDEDTKSNSDEDADSTSSSPAQSPRKVVKPTPAPKKEEKPAPVPVKKTAPAAAPTPAPAPTPAQPQAQAQSATKGAPSGSVAGIMTSQPNKKTNASTAAAQPSNPPVSTATAASSSSGSAASSSAVTSAVSASATTSAAVSSASEKPVNAPVPSPVASTNKKPQQESLANIIKQKNALEEAAKARQTASQQPPGMSAFPPLPGSASVPTPANAAPSSTAPSPVPPQVTAAAPTPSSATQPQPSPTAQTSKRESPIHGSISPAPPTTPSPASSSVVAFPTQSTTPPIGAQLPASSLNVASTPSSASRKKEEDSAQVVAMPGGPPLPIAHLPPSLPQPSPTAVDTKPSSLFDSTIPQQPPTLPQLQLNQPVQPPASSPAHQNLSSIMMPGVMGMLPLGPSIPATTPHGSTHHAANLPSNQLPAEYAHHLKLLDVSLRNLPLAVDTERSRSYVPRNPFPTPSCFPSTPAPILEDPAIIEKLDTDVLFFIFYFQQGTPYQYLAARELKKQSWRYHKNFLTWFQRHEDPKQTTDEYEQGTYVYFDYETGWCRRIKKDFTFQYRHLEDELQVNP